MYDFSFDAGDKPALYRELLGALDALTAGEPDAVANMANAAALIGEALPELNWAGFYRLVDGELVLGPFVGRPVPVGRRRGVRIGRVGHFGQRVVDGRCRFGRLTRLAPSW